MAKKDLTASRLRELLTYHPDTGRFTRRIRHCNAVRAGDDVAGSAHDLGYRMISVDGEQYLAHRLVWLYSYGEWPVGDVDHENRDKADNRLANLRLATRSQNCFNRRIRSDNTTGYSNVLFDKKRQTYFVQVKAAGRRYKRCGFATPEAANEAAKLLTKEHHGAFSKHR